VLPAPDTGVQSIGATIRAVRVTRGLTQQRVAKEAKVSRAQLALLEQGGNVSIRFLLKVARFLEIRTIPLDGTVELTSGGREGLKVFELLQSLDLLAALVEHIRGFAMTAVLPPSERGTLSDSLALRDFVAKHLRDDVGVQRLANAIVQLSDDVPAGATPPRVDDVEKAQAKPRRARRSVE
jgi:transcriptional regulator with XRE-family HTH domain